MALPREIMIAADENGNFRGAHAQDTPTSMVRPLTQEDLAELMNSPEILIQLDKKTAECAELKDEVDVLTSEATDAQARITALVARVAELTNGEQ